jgi:hypothetical protein
MELDPDIFESRIRIWSKIIRIRNSAVVSYFEIWQTYARLRETHFKRIKYVIN